MVKSKHTYMCMIVDVYVYTSICMYVRTHARMHAWMIMTGDVCMYARMDGWCMSVSLYVYVYVYV